MRHANLTFHRKGPDGRMLYRCDTCGHIDADDATGQHNCLWVLKVPSIRYSDSSKDSKPYLTP